MKDIVRNAVSIIVGFIALWYIGAMSDFFPFYADALEIRASAYTGFIVCLVIVICSCWIIHEIRNGKGK